ncbi:MAG TPA: anti-sigma F factor antagonist [Candidatus Deferrimicrobium sp.]|nr:anti-sigma F factor antagonist [Candidatus Deferrimicrobium sp.]
MGLEKKYDRDTLVIKVTGELDLVVADEFRRVVDPELERRQVKNLVINLNGVSFIDSSGLGVILGRYKKLLQTGGKIWIAEPRPPVRKILELSGFPRIMPFFDSEKQALEAVREA